jgi:broad specificity phosphatase PhoE
MKATTILLMRHGETDWNRGQIFRGAADVPLNAKGRAQARLLAKALAPRRIDAAYSSPLSRAQETARLVLAPHNITTASHAGLRDCDYGQWTGFEEAVVAQKWPTEHAQWLTAPQTIRPPDGETLQEVFDRSVGALEAIVQQHCGQTVALVAHRVINKLLMLGMLTLGIERFPFIRQDNCCLNEVEWTAQGYIVISLNDTSHLRQGQMAWLTVDF